MRLPHQNNTVRTFRAIKKKRSYFIGCLQLGVKLAEDLSEIFADDIGEYVQSASEKTPGYQ